MEGGGIKARWREEGMDGRRGGWEGRWKEGREYKWVSARREQRWRERQAK